MEVGKLSYLQKMLIDISLDYTLKIVLLGSLLLGIVAGALGSFAVLRKQSLLGDAISHAALPGIALAFIFTLSKHPLVLLIGALLAGWIGTLFVLLVTKLTKLKEDAALGILLSVFFGFGVFLLTKIQNLKTATKAGLDKFLFGNAATLLKEDVITMSVLGLIALFLLFLFWKEFKILTFDRSFAQSIGFNSKYLDILLMTLIVMAIVVGLQTVGVVLMSAMIIAPAVAARQWTDRLNVLVFLSAFFGGISGVVGALLSSSISKLPTGPTIVLVASLIVFISLVFSPHRGMAMDWLKTLKNKKTIHKTRVLYYLFKLAESHNNIYYSHDVSSIKAIDKTSVDKALQQLKIKGFVQNTEGSRWKLTSKGLAKAKRIPETVV
ncbi:metal ABC transporter permease [Candidatus Woesearchaeota archaeon]|nr:metal ABC transporter permease [Candidatus Woesearchaeota archaeon]